MVECFTCGYLVCIEEWEENDFYCPECGDYSEEAEDKYAEEYGEINAEV